jgi:putative ABC transport system permease protein
MAVCILLLCILESVNHAIVAGLATAKDSRLITRHNVSVVFPLPITHRERISALPGVRNVSISNWFGGIYQDRKNFFPNFAVDFPTYLDMYPEYIVQPDTRKELLEDLKGCLIGPALAERWGWKVGSVFQLQSLIPTYQKAEPFEFVVKGIYGVDDRKYPGTIRTLMFFHHKYLYEGTGQKIGVGTFPIEIENPDQAIAVAKTIDDLFENSDAQTKTETEAAFRAGFVSLGGNLAFLLRTVGLAVIFTIMLVLANTMSMAVRERRTEIGILKTLGFSNARVLGVILTEAVLLGILGGLAGVAAGYGMIAILPNLPQIGDAVRQFPNLAMTPNVAGTGVIVAVLIGLGAGLVPALLSYRARITGLLRQV